jgi:competence protein ComEA
MRCLLLMALLPTAVGALELNTANRARLERLQGVGVATAERIVQARAQRPFADWDDLAARVAGLRGRKAEALHRQGLTVSGRPLRIGEGKDR